MTPNVVPGKGYPQVPEGSVPVKMLGFALLERYIFKRALIAVLTVIAALTGVVWVVRAVQEVDLILSKGQGILTYLQMTTLGVPTLVAAIAPLALLIGLIQTINRLNEESELVVMHASGASRLTLLKPFLALSIVVCLGVYILALWTGPSAMATLRAFVTAVRADLVSVVVREGLFQKVGDGLTFHVGERLPGGVLRGVFVQDSREEKESLTYIAREGRIAKIDGGNFLVLLDGQIQRQSNESGNLSVIGFNSYAFNLASFSGDKAVKLLKPPEFPTWQLIFPDIANPAYQREPERFRGELHIRLTSGLHALMAGLIVLAFLGNPVSHRQGHVLAVAGAAGSFVVIRGIAVVVEGQIRSNDTLIFMVWIIPLLVIAICLYLLFTGRTAVSAASQARFDASIQAGADWVRRNLPTLDRWINSLRQPS